MTQEGNWRTYYSTTYSAGDFFNYVPTIPAPLMRIT